MQELRADVAIIGGGTGGVAGALAALRLGKTVIMTEETDWIGGQLTAQAVPPDEHPWIEQFGCTATYRKFRDGVRAYYRANYPLTKEARERVDLNPGDGWVSRLCHEPRVGLAVLESFLLPYLSNGQLKLLLRTVPIGAEVEGDRIQCIQVQSRETGNRFSISAPYFLDATELGDLLPLTDTELVTGAEGQNQTGEPHAPADAQPLNQQSISHCFAMSYHDGENHVIDRPAQYDFWQTYASNFWPGRNLDWIQTHPITLEDRHRTLFSAPGQDPWTALWPFRQILNDKNFEPGFFPSPITLVNWPQLDYWLGPIIGVSDEDKAKHLEGASQLALSFFYWMQTEAPRHDGGSGYPGLKIRGDITGTENGLAKYVYIREARRIKAEFTVLEQHVASDIRPDGAEKFNDSVGVGCYRIDLHPSCGASGTDADGVNYIDVGSWPFQIPLGSLIPQRVENLLPACKNLGVTHITNGCYRLHPVEWNIGEAAGALAAHCVTTGESPRGVRNSAEKLKDFQDLIVRLGFELDWPQLHAV